MKTNRLNKILAASVAAMLIGGTLCAQPRSSAQGTSGSAPQHNAANRSDANKVQQSSSEHNHASSHASSATHNSVSNKAKPNAVRQNTRHDVGNASTFTNNSHMRGEHVSPSSSYSNMPHKGQYVSKSHVKKAACIHHHDSDYYYRNGVFYRYESGKYKVSKAPVGIRVSLLPEPRLIWVENVQYYYYYGTYYKYITSSREYEVVTPPVGAIVESIPDGYETVLVNGQTYYIVDDAQYKAVVYHGEIWYEVIKVM